MHSAERTFLDYDLPQLRMIAEVVGVELQARNARSAATELAQKLCQPAQVTLVLSSVSEKAQIALRGLLAGNGKMPLLEGERQLGTVRPLGSIAREREQPHRRPASVAEELWYRGLLGRAFARQAGDVQEFFYIPNELQSLLAEALPPVQRPVGLAGLPAVSAVTSPIQRANSALVDDACTVLAYLQTYTVGEKTLSETIRAALDPQLHYPRALEMLLTLLAEMGILASHVLRLRAEAAREFLRQPRAHQLQRLATAWLASPGWRDLLAVPSLVVDSVTAQQLQPPAARQILLPQLARLQSGQWTKISELVAHLYQTQPEFLRYGDYESWYLRERKSGVYLRGFESWFLVEGALLQFYLGEVLPWLGLLDLAGEENERMIRPTTLLPAFLGQEAWQIPEKAPPLQVRSDGCLIVPRAANRYLRFQAARIGDWELPPDPQHYCYRLSAAGLQRGVQGGVRPAQVRAFLQRASGKPLPAPVAQALTRWEQNGVEARLGMALVLRVRDEALLTRLRENSKVRRYLGEALGPLAVMVQARNWHALQRELLQMGVLLTVDE